MECLSNKSLRQYNNLSRYQNVPFYYHNIDNKYTVGITGWLKNTTSYTVHTVVFGDTLDSLALQYYNVPTYYWVIADFNRINDPFIQLVVGQLIKIPVLSSIEFLENR